jgi:hypothetical protein
MTKIEKNLKQKKRKLLIKSRKKFPKITSSTNIKISSILVRIIFAPMDPDPEAQLNPDIR